MNALVKGLLARGHSVVLITASPYVSRPFKLERGSLDLTVVPFRPRPRDRAKDFFAVERKAIRNALTTYNVDVVHAHWTYEYAWSALSSRAPLLVTAHDSPIETVKQYRDAYRVVRALMGIRVRIGMRNLTVVSPYLGRMWKRQQLWRRGASVIPNISPFPPQPEREYSPESLKIIDIADGSGRKNVKALICAFESIKKEEASATLTLIGGGLGPNDPIARWAQDRGWGKGVRFLGASNRATVAAELASATMFVHPSLEESQPMCLLEAFSYGLPVIAGKNAGGTAWTLDDGAAGHLIESLTGPDIASAVVDLHRDPARQLRYRRNAKRLVSLRYSEESVTSAYIDIYASLYKGLAGA